MEKFGEVTGVDIDFQALKYAKMRKVNCIHASVTKLPFVENYFDLVTSIDVIYHKKVQDIKALSEFFRVLKPNGILILRVPAIASFKTAHDEFVHTRERYNKLGLRKKLEKIGYKIEKLSYVNFILLIPVIFTLFREVFYPPKKLKSGIKKLPEYMNNLLINLMNLENFLVKKLNIPIGIGLIAVCSK